MDTDERVRPRQRGPLHGTVLFFLAAFMMELFIDVVTHASMWFFVADSCGVALGWRQLQRPWYNPATDTPSARMVVGDTALAAVLVTCAIIGLVTE